MTPRMQPNAHPGRLTTMAEITRRSLFLFLTPVPAWLTAADWHGAAFPNWDDDAVLKLLLDSPWARQRRIRFTWVKRNEQPITYKDVPGANANAPASSTVQGGSPVGGIGAGKKQKIPESADLLFRWVTALPLRQAKALYKQRDAKLPPQKALEMVESRTTDYVFEIFGLPVIAAHRGAAAVEDKLRLSVVLRTKSGRTLRPTKVDSSVDGETMSARVHFDGSEPITMEDREVEVSGNADIFEFRERFRLATMAYLGYLEM